MKRPIEKQIVLVKKNVTTTNVGQSLFVADIPGTLFGIRYQCYAYTNDLLSSSAEGSWALYVLPGAADGADANQVNAPQANSFQDLLVNGSEDSVLASGIIRTRKEEFTLGVDTRAIVIKEWNDKGIVKTKRKMKVGGAFALQMQSDALLGLQVSFIVTFFFRT